MATIKPRVLVLAPVDDDTSDLQAALNLLELPHQIEVLSEGSWPYKLRQAVRLRRVIQQVQPNLIHVRNSQYLTLLKLAQAWQSPRPLFNEALTPLPPVVLPSSKMPENKVILGFGCLDRVEPLKQLIWAFDVIRHTDPALELHLVGDGPARSWLEGFAQRLAWDDSRIRFLGKPTNWRERLRPASVIWVSQHNQASTLAQQAVCSGIWFFQLNQITSTSAVHLARDTHKALQATRPEPQPQLAERYTVRNLAQFLLTAYHDCTSEV